MYFEDTLTIDKPLTEAVTQKERSLEKDVNFIVLAVDSPHFGVEKKGYQLDVCGKPMIEWVENACASIPSVKRVPFKFDLLKEIKPLLNDATWTIVLFSDTPLLTRKTVENAFAIAEQKGLNVLKLTRGYVFNTEYISRVEEIFGTETYYLEEEDFIIATNFKQLSIVRDIMKGRICDYFMRNGVDIVDPSSTFIDANASIGKNSVIMPFVRLVGKIQIAENCTIKSGCVLEDCVVGANAVLENCQIKNSVLYKGVAVENAVLEDVVLKGELSTIKNNSVLNKVCALGRLNVDGARLKNVKTEGCVEIKQGAVLVSETGNIKLFGNNVVGANASVLTSVCIGENVKVKDGENVSKDIDAVKFD